jgi:competence protein ComEA
VVVDVAGKVRRPGVYHLPGGARVDDAIRAAGGALAGARLDRLNLAARLVDGQQVAVGIPPAAGGGGGPAVAGSGSPAPSGGASTAGPVDLNTAGLDQLETLPGVGPVLAQHILDWRTAHGSFASVDQLNDVSGIGEVKFAALRPLVSV